MVNYYPIIFPEMGKNHKQRIFSFLGWLSSSETTKSGEKPIENIKVARNSGKNHGIKRKNKADIAFIYDNMEKE